MGRILVTFGVPCLDSSAFAPHTVVMPELGKAFSREEMLSLLPECDAVLACTALTREMILAGRRLRLIVCYGAGYDAIDVSAATENSIPVCNLPDSVTEGTAELTMALTLAIARRVPELDALVREGADAFGLGKRMGVSLRGQTLGVVGMGRIGARVAELARAFGMRILYTAHGPKPAQDALGARYRALDELLKESDFVTLHCPHTPETDGLISRERLALMKPTAFLINTARGKIVNEDALIAALRERRIAGAALDVYRDEPHVPEALRQLPNVVLTPHAGSNTPLTREHMASDACQRLLDGLAGRRPENLLNPEVWERRRL